MKHSKHHNNIVPHILSICTHATPMLLRYLGGVHDVAFEQRLMTDVLNAIGPTDDISAMLDEYGMNFLVQIHDQNEAEGAKQYADATYPLHTGGYATQRISFYLCNYNGNVCAVFGKA